MASGKPRPTGSARSAAERNEWDEVLSLIASGADRCTGSDFASIADGAYAAGRLDVTIATWERAHTDALRAADPLSAAGAAVRVAMHLLFDTGLMAPVRGWLNRTDRLLEGYADTPVHAWLAVLRSYERLLSGDLSEAHRLATEAVARGVRSDAAAAAVGRVAEARCLILTGDVGAGLDLLNEAAVAGTSGELEPLTSGVVYCEVVCALQALAQYDLAEQWTVAMESWRRREGVGSIHGRCRVHRAEILRLRGALADAEGQALRACEEMRPYARRELGWPLTELGHIRLRAGDLGGAEEAFRAAHDLGWDPYPGLALVHLAKGEGSEAVEAIRNALERPLNVPSKELPPNTDLRRAPLLAAQVEIETQAGDLHVARRAAEELAGIARTYRSRALEAMAMTADGWVALAAGESGAARRAFDVAVQLWSAISAPYEAAEARLGLARALRELGMEGQSAIELEGARSAFHRLGARRDGKITRREGWHAAEFPVASQPSRGDRKREAHENVLRHEGDHWLVAFDGRSLRVRDLKGLRYLARLLANPGRELHACDLAAGEGTFSASANPESPTARAIGIPILDRQAKEAYRRRLDEIEEDIEQAGALGDDERRTQAELERDFLARELARAVGLGGRSRLVGSNAERARVSVTRALRRAISRLHTLDPELAQHLDRFLRTGTYCVYLPDPRAGSEWNVSGPPA